MHHKLQTRGGGIISDTFYTEERGLAVGIWSLGPIFGMSGFSFLNSGTQPNNAGPTLGPVVGGFVAASIGWRWDFWIVFILGALISVLIFFFNTKTSHKILIQRKILLLEKILDQQRLRSCYEGAETLQKGRILAHSLLSPLKMLFGSPRVFFLSLYTAFIYGVMYLLFTTITDVFRDNYGFLIATTGLVYISLGFGNGLGWAGVVR